MEWREIPGYPGNFASDDGRIRSHRGNVLKPYRGGTVGYFTVSVLAEGGRRRHASVHRLVLLAFTGPPPGRLDTCHINGDHDDNRPSNLRWGTRSENILDLVRHGTHNNARKTHCLRGHAFTEENTAILSRGRRECLTCRRMRGAAAYQRRKELVQR